MGLAGKSRIERELFITPYCSAVLLVPRSRCGLYFVPGRYLDPSPQGWESIVMSSTEGVGEWFFGRGLGDWVVVVV